VERPDVELLANKFLKAMDYTARRNELNSISDVNTSFLTVNATNVGLSRARSSRRVDFPRMLFEDQLASQSSRPGAGPEFLDSSRHRFSPLAPFSPATTVQCWSYLKSITTFDANQCSASGIPAERVERP